MTRIRTVAALIALAAGSVATVAHAQDSVGVNAAIRNSVRTQPAGQSALRPAALRAEVRIGDAIVTGAQSQLQVLLRDRTVFTVGSNARVTIDRFVFDSERSAGGATASVARGAFRFASGRGGPRQGAVRTPVASIGVRGTIVETVVGPDALTVLGEMPGMPPFTGSPDEATLIVLRGPGPRGSGLDTPGAIDVTGDGTTFVLERPGMSMFVWQGGAFGPFQLSDEASLRLSSLLRGTPSANTDSGPTDVLSAGVDSGDAAFFGEGVATDPAQTVEPTLDCKVGQSGPSRSQGGPVAQGSCGGPRG